LKEGSMDVVGLAYGFGAQFSSWITAKDVLLTRCKPSPPLP
jgi:NAD dependent epimerase/dehydratase family enzyme